MKQIRLTLKELETKTIPIGREGENDYTVVTIDCAEVFEKHPNAAATMRAQNYRKQIYPVTIVRDGNDIVWTVKESDLTVKGDGRIQLTFTEGTIIHKTVIGRTLVLKSLITNGPAPDPVQDWLDEAEDTLEDLEDAEVNQPIIGEDGYWYTWNQEAGEYQKTDTKAQGEDGQDGHTPEKGVDYWTAADKAEMESDVAGAIIDDTSTALDKTWSASKSGQLLSALQEKQLKPYDDPIKEIPFSRSYIINNGVVTALINPSPEKIVTNAISVAGYSTVHINAKANWGGDFYAFYSANDTLVSRRQCSSTSATIDSFSDDVEVPDGAAKLYVAYSTTNGTAEPDVKLVSTTVYYDINLNDYLIDKKRIENLESFADCENVVSSDLWDIGDVLNGYYDTEGAFNASTEYKSCNFVDISSFSYVILTFDFYTNMPVIYDTWDVNKTLIEGTRVNKAAGETLTVRIDIEDGIKYLTVNNRSNNNPTIIGYKESKAVNIIRKGLKGKKISFLGDSITTYTGYIPQGNETYYTGSNCGVSSVNQTWWKRVIDFCEMELLVNNSWSGATISDIRDSYAPGSSGVDRCESLHSGTTNPDVIIVFMGTNDFRNDTPMGTYDGSTTLPVTASTFRDAVAVMLSKILTKYPTAITYICTLKQFEHYNDSDIGFPDKNGIGLTTDDYTNALLSLATLFGVPVIDFNKSGLNYFNLPEYCGDYNPTTQKGLHPNAAGMKKLAERAIKDIIPNL